MIIQLGRYSYDCPFDVAVGDVVSVPATWLDRTHGRYLPKQETVTDVNTPPPDGIELTKVLGVVKRANVHT